MTKLINPLLPMMVTDPDRAFETITPAGAASAKLSPMLAAIVPEDVVTQMTFKSGGGSAGTMLTHAWGVPINGEFINNQPMLYELAVNMTINSSSDSSVFALRPFIGRADAATLTLDRGPDPNDITNPIWGTIAGRRVAEANQVQIAGSCNFLLGPYDNPDSPSENPLIAGVAATNTSAGSSAYIFAEGSICCYRSAAGINHFRTG